MIYRIRLYGDPVLKKKAQEVKKEHDLTELVDNLFETMYASNGVGLAAPQVGISLRIFVVDSTQMESEDEKEGVTCAFINPEIIAETGVVKSFEEGCLSIPGIHENIMRKPILKLRYFDADWVEQIKTFEGNTARVIQHEFDHLNGVLFIDYLSSLKKRLIKNKLRGISKGDVDVSYAVKTYTSE